MAVSFEFEVDQYVVGYAYGVEVGNFRSIVLESTRRLLGTAPYQATLYFFPNGRPDRTQPIGSYRPEGLGGRILANLDLHDFEGIYAMLRSERPIFIRGGGTGDVQPNGRHAIDYFEIHSNKEPVGEVDSNRRKVIVGTGELLGDVSDLASTFR